MVQYMTMSRNCKAEYRAITHVHAHKHNNTQQELKAKHISERMKNQQAELSF